MLARTAPRPGSMRSVRLMRRVLGSPWVTALLAALVLVLAATVVQERQSSHAKPRIEEGWASVQGDPVDGIVTVFGCCGASRANAGGTGYSVSDVMWRDLTVADQSWTSGSGVRSCLVVNTRQRVRFGVVVADPDGERPGTEKVVWIECLPDKL